MIEHEVSKSSRPFLQRPLFLWALWIAYTLLVVILSAFHEQWVDEFNVWFMCKNNSLAELWSAMKREGHFLLWHLLVLPWAKIGCPYWFLQVVSISLVSGAAWLLIFKSPFDVLSKCFILFCYPFLYEFPVIARCYALIPITLFAIAACYRHQEERPFLYCALIGLLAHSHAYMEGLVAALFFLFCYEHIYLRFKKGESAKKYIAAAGITIGIVLVAGLQVLGSLGYAHDTFSDNTDTFADLWRKLMIYTYAFPIKVICNVLPFRDNGYSDILGSILSLCFWILILYLIYLIFWKEKNNRKLLAVNILAVGWQILMAMKVFQFGNQRVYLPMLILLFLLWCGYSKKVSRYCIYLTLALFILTGRYGELVRDIKQNHSSELAVYDSIQSVTPDNSTLLFLLDSEYEKQHYTFSYDVLKDMYPRQTIILQNYPYDHDSIHSLSSEDNGVFLITSDPITNDFPGYQQIELLGYYPRGYHQHFPFQYIYRINSYQ